MNLRPVDLPDVLLTLEEYAQLPDDPYYIDELSKGRLVREPRPSARHGIVAFEIASLLRQHVERHELGLVVMACGFVLSRDPAVLRGPDVAFIGQARMPAEIPSGWWPFAPDLAVEVVSPSNTASYIETKVLEFLDAGTRMVWVIDPKSRTARIYQGNEARIVREHDTIDGDDVVPGFSVSLSSLLI